MNSSFVTPGLRLADIGTDHGYIPIALVQEGMIPSAIAMDVNQGPLDRAKEHIKEYHMEDRIHTRLSDGVQNLHPGEADSVLIAGMGGGLIIKILVEGRKILETVKEIILQPQSEIEKVRHYLETEGYQIVKEDMIFEDGKYYSVMKVHWGDMHYDREIDYLYGKLLLEEKHPVLKEYLIKRRENCYKILEQLKYQGKQEERIEKRTEQIEEELEQIRLALSCYEM